MREVFHTEIHYYNLNGERHIAGAGAPSVPAALAPVLAGFSSLSNIFPRPGTHLNLRSVKKDPESGGWIPNDPQPAFTFLLNNTPLYLLSPLDFAKIYNVLPLWTADRPITGKGQTIAILAGSDIQQADWNTFRAAFGLNAFSGTLSQVHPPTPAGEPLSDNNNCMDPGLIGVQHEGRRRGRTGRGVVECSRTGCAHFAGGLRGYGDPIQFSHCCQRSHQRRQPAAHHQRQHRGVRAIRGRRPKCLCKQLVAASRSGRLNSNRGRW